MTVERYRDWESIGQKYAESSMSLQELAETEGISLSTLKKHSTKEGWQQLRKRRQLEQRSVRLELVADKLLGSICITYVRNPFASPNPGRSEHESGIPVVHRISAE